MTNAELLNLLREAADHMKAIAKDRGPCPDCVSCDRGLDITTRIDAALTGATEKPEIRSVKVGELEWQADVADKRMTWQEAKDYAASLGNGWRLPTRTELLTLVDDTRYDPACSVFSDCTGEWFWTSTPWAGSSSLAWVVSFSDGGDHHFFDVGNNYRVRCVR